MKVGFAAQGAVALQKPLTTSDTLTRDRRDAQSGASAAAEKVPQEEILNKVKALAEDGTYSVRFERDQETDQVVMRLVDAKTGDLIRQIPPEELLQLAQTLDKLKGQLLHTTS